MFDLGFTELLTFGIIALIVLGPEKLPQAMRTLGTYYAKFRRTMSTIQAQMESELDLAETRQKMQQELAKIKQAELQMQNQMAQMRQNMRQFELSQDKQLANQDPSTPALTDAGSSDNDSDTGECTDASAARLDSLKSNKTDGYVSNQDLEGQLLDARLKNTKPWENMWFRLGDYDKARRLPAAPLLPNYEADKLLNESVPVVDQSTKKV